MKRIIGVIFIFVTICFVLPILFTIRNTAQEVIVNVEEVNIIANNVNNNNYDYKQYSTIKLLHTETGKIEEISLDEYLYGVVASEMPANFEIEALKAQAIVARTYTIYKIINENKHGDANICDTSTCCQAWISKEERYEKWGETERESNWSKICEAVNSTKGKIVTYNSKPIKAFFHANSGGKTETVVNVWGEGDYPYLQTVETVGEDAYTQYKSEVIISNEELLAKLSEYYQDIKIDFTNEEAIQVLENNESGRVKIIKFGNKNLSGVETRGIFGLKSACFTVERKNENIKFDVVGYGHGVGLSQTGANSLAQVGKSCEEIIKHYYTGVEIINM